MLLMDMGNNAQARNLTSEAFAATLRAERAALGLSQKDLYTAAKIPSSTYFRLESGERTMNTAQLGDICKALGMSITEFALRAEARRADLERARDDLRDAQ